MKKESVWQTFMRGHLTNIMTALGILFGILAIIVLQVASNRGWIDNALAFQITTVALVPFVYGAIAALRRAVEANRKQGEETDKKMEDFMRRVERHLEIDKIPDEWKPPPGE